MMIAEYDNKCSSANNNSDENVVVDVVLSVKSFLVYNSIIIYFYSSYCGRFFLNLSLTIKAGDSFNMRLS